MKKRGLQKSITGLGFILFLGICFTACKEEETPPPTLDIFVTVDGFTVNIAADSPEATSWSWNYGDGTTSDSTGSHSYTYETGGEFTITGTVTGEGGTTSETEAVTIATIQELLSGEAGSGGKTWVLSHTPGGVDGVGHIKTELVPNIFPAIVDLLDFIGIPDEYDNLYTFHPDGSYDLDNVNGDVMCPWVFSAYEIDPADIVITTGYGFHQIHYPDIEGATWILHENADLTLETVYDEDIDVGPKPGVRETVSWENVDYITFEGDGFLGLQDYTTIAMIREISPDRMVISLFYHEYWGDPENDGNLNMLPSLALTLSFDAQ